jgi:hypothetical protein
MTGAGPAALRNVARIDAVRFGTPATCATGVFVGQGLLATSYQAIRGADRVTVTPETGIPLGNVQVAAYNVMGDLAILRVSGAPLDSLALGTSAVDDQYLWSVSYPSCQGVPSTSRIRMATWLDRPNGLLRHTGQLAESAQGSALIDRTGALVGVVNGDRTVAAPYNRVQAMLGAARAFTTARAVVDVARQESHVLGSFFAQSDATEAVARVTPLESWHWAGLARANAPLPLTFTGPIGRYQVDLLVAGAVRASTTVTVAAGTTTQVRLTLPPLVAQQAPAPAPAPAPQPAAPPPTQVPAARRGGGGSIAPLVLLLLGGAGAGVYFATKKKADTDGGNGTTPPATGGILVSVPNP